MLSFNFELVQLVLQITLLSEKFSSLGVVVSCFLPHDHFFPQISNESLLLCVLSFLAYVDLLKLADSLLSELDDHLISRTLLFVAFNSLLDTLGLELKLLYFPVIVLLLTTQVVKIGTK